MNAFRAERSDKHLRTTEGALHATEEQMRLLLEGVRDYAIFMLDPEGVIASWSPAAQRLKGWTADEAVGRHFSMFYPREDVARGKPRRELEIAVAEGRCEDEAWRVRKDGSRFWANVVITPLYDADGTLRGFGKVTRDLTERKRAEDELRSAKEIAEAANRELEAFSYSISHDLRAPLRTIDGFSKVLLEEYAANLDPRGQDYLGRVRAGAQRMGQLIDDVLRLSRVSRAAIVLEPVDLTAMARQVAGEYEAAQPELDGCIVVQEGMRARADPVLLRQLLANLLDNAVKFTRKTARPQIEVGMSEGPDGPRYFVRDNGAGFDMTYVDKLFSAFQRLHSASDYPGNGIGLATVQRIASRHGGDVDAVGRPGGGATIFFTLGTARSRP